MGGQQLPHKQPRFHQASPLHSSTTQQPKANEMHGITDACSWFGLIIEERRQSFKLVYPRPGALYTRQEMLAMFWMNARSAGTFGARFVEVIAGRLLQTMR